MIREQLIGAWKLVSIVVQVDATLHYPYGEHPVGRLIYEEAGRMSAQIMRPGRQSPIGDPTAVASASIDELRQIAEGYIGYFGSFTLDEENKTLTHRVEACTLPAWVGTEQKREYEFDGPRLVLSAGPNKIVWERLPG